MNDLDATWKRLYEIISKKVPSLGASLTGCRLKQVADNYIEIEVRDNGFTMNMLQREKNKAALKEVCTAYFGQAKDIVLISPSEPVDEHPKKKSQNDHLIKQKALSHPLVADAIEIFNGKLIDVKIQ